METSDTPIEKKRSYKEYQEDYQEFQDVAHRFLTKHGDALYGVAIRPNNSKLGFALIAEGCHSLLKEKYDLLD